MIKSQFLFVTSTKQTLYCFKRIVKAFKTGAYSVIKSFKAQSKHKTIFCYGPKKNNRLNARINRLFWFDSKSITKNSFQPLSKHLSIKQSVANPNDAKNLRWHVDERKCDGMYRHPVDSVQWKKFDDEFW